MDALGPVFGRRRNPKQDVKLPAICFPKDSRISSLSSYEHKKSERFYIFLHKSLLCKTCQQHLSPFFHHAFLRFSRFLPGYKSFSENIKNTSVRLVSIVGGKKDKFSYMQEKVLIESRNILLRLFICCVASIKFLLSGKQFRDSFCFLLHAFDMCSI